MARVSKNSPKGFAGLEDMVSDIDPVVEPPRQAAIPRPVPPPITQAPSQNTKAATPSQQPLTKPFIVNEVPLSPKKSGNSNGAFSWIVGVVVVWFAIWMANSKNDTPPYVAPPTQAATQSIPMPRAERPTAPVTSEKCSLAALGKKSTAKLCSGSMSECGAGEVREELQRRGIYEYESGCKQALLQKQNRPDPIAQSSPRVVVPIDRDRYNDALRLIESQHQELNPDSPSKRNDLIALAVRRKQAYVQQGLAPHDALVRAVADLDSEGMFRTQARTESVPHQEKAAAVEASRATQPRALDPGGHPGFPSNCRWVTPQEWSCL